MSAQPAIVVIDVPERATPDDAAQLLNAPGDSYFLVEVLPVVGGHRAYLRRYKQTPTKAETAKAIAGNVDEATARSILRANRDKTVRTIVSLLQAAGLKRGRHWVCDQLDATCAEDGREEEALRCVKTMGAEGREEPKCIVDILRSHFKIRRSIAWARRKLEELRATVQADNS